MTLQKGYLNRRTPSLKLSKLEIVIGVVLGITYSIIFFLFLKLFREIIRITPGIINNYPEIIILDDKVVNFYNFFFAFIAVLFAQSYVVTYWFDKPQRFGERYHYKKATIVNDQRMTNWYFVHWFAKVGFIVGLVAVDWFGFNVYENYKYTFYLGALVLFLQGWLSFRLFYRKKSIKWVLISFVSIIALSFILSKIELIDYNKINKNILKYNPIYNYDIHPPKSVFSNQIKDKNFLNELFFYNDKGFLIINYKNNNYNIDYLPRLIKNIQNNLYAYENELSYYMLYINKKESLKNIKYIEDILSENDINNLAYTIQKFDDNRPYYFGKNYYLKKPLQLYEHNKTSNNIISIVQNKSLVNKNLVIIDKDTINLKSLEKVLKTKILNSSDYLINFNIDDDLTFQNYIDILSSIQLCINDLREDYKSKTYGDRIYDQLNYDDFYFEDNYKIINEQKKDIELHYPLSIKINIIEVNHNN